MNRNTNDTPKTGNHRSVNPTPGRDLGNEPDMITLGKLIDALPPERREALNKMLDELAETED